MYLTNFQTFIMILVIALGTMITRFTPFLLFPENKKIPTIVQYLGRVLPAAMMGLLVIYCLKDSFFNNDFPPQIISIVFLIIIHLWKKNVLISIALGTLFHMVLIQFIFI